MADQGNIWNAPYFLAQTKQDEWRNMTAKYKRERVRQADAKIVDFAVGKRIHRGSTTNMGLVRIIGND